VPLTFGIGSDTLAALTHFFIAHGLPLLFVVVMLESFGIPLPGETALIAFGILASQGNYSIVTVIVVAAAGAIVGDNLGYWLLGRLGGRALFRRWGWLKRYSERVLPRVERLMQRHGGKTVFFGRWFPVLRITAAWLAGANHMPWRKFFLFNALGGIGWAASMSTVGYVAGRQAENLITLIAALVAVAVVLAVFGHNGLRRLGRSRA
jgi:membrane protein DedA with SNARE-associated domain